MARNWTAGDLIMGRYRLVSLLGQGGMGSVWRAEHTELKNQVAIKLLDPAIAQNEEMIGRFLREARAAASLQNRHVIQIFDHGVADGEAFMVMELLEGESLGQRLQKGPLSVEETLKFMSQVMRAMAKAHEAGIIHRDLKPDNIFITYDDEGEYAKVLDFGVAKVSGDLSVTNGVKTQTGMMLGTPYYMSPEQAKAKKVDARTDVWALAVITYECLVGKRPFTGDSFADLVLTLCSGPIPIPSHLASVPVGFDEWFVHATQRDVDRRFRSARDMANELVQLAQASLTGKTGMAAAGGIRPREAMGASTPAHGTGGRMSLTTGQSAAVEVSRARFAAQASESHTWIYASVAVLLLAFGIGAYSYRSANQQTSAAESAAAPDSAAVAAPEKPTAITPSPTAAAKPEPPAATNAAAPDLSAPPAAVPTPPAPTTPVAAPQSAPRAHNPTTRAAPTSMTPAKPPAPAPVAKPSALPPTEWEF